MNANKPAPTVTENFPRLETSIADSSTIAPQSAVEYDIENTPFDYWPKIKSLSDSTCNYCNHIECVC